MAETNASASAFDDVRTAIIYFILPILAGTALSPVGLVGIAVPMILYKLSRRVNWLFIYIALCAALFVVGVLLGSIPALREPYSSVLNALASPHFDPAVLFDRWLRLAEFPAVWFALLPFGGVIGTVFSLVEDDREQSQLAALTRGEVVAPLKRALLASWFQRRIDAKPARRGANIVLGGDWRTGQAIEIPDADLNRHLLLAGTTGAGKTVGLINLIEGSPGIGTIIVDGKGDIELARRVMALAKSRGQKAFLIGGPDQNESAVYNPLNGNDFTSLADRIVTLREWTEPYYLALAKGFAQTAFKVLAACGQRVDLVTL
ncbi:hypothetical protein [Bosea sp. (in: a-proteobacteria)]|jgi:hypothetical protein|uniref:hypothetical protein n=1 Tax=Bosea sp. (in: a-proteobacteria) TaxID=1871050 RepID=UPI003F72985A